MPVTAVRNLTNRDELMLTAIREAGMEATLKVVETFLSRSYPDPAKYGRAARHPAFAHLTSDYQREIKDLRDHSRLEWFCRKLLELLSVRYGLERLRKDASKGAMRYRISELRNQ